MNELSSLGARTGARSVEAAAAPRGVFLQRLLARVRARPEWVCMPLTLVLLIGGWEWERDRAQGEQPHPATAL